MHDMSLHEPLLSHTVCTVNEAAPLHYEDDSPQLLVVSRTLTYSHVLHLVVPLVTLRDNDRLLTDDVILDKPPRVVRKLFSKISTNPRQGNSGFCLHRSHSG